MEAFFTMLQNVIIFVALAVPGFLLAKLKLIKKEHSGVLSALLVNVGVPFLIISSLQNVTMDGEISLALVLIGVIGLAFTFLMFFLSAFLTNKSEETKKRGMTRFGMIFANNGFLGIPLAQATFGNGSKALAFLIILNVLSNIMMYTVGVYLISGDKKSIQLKKAFINPFVISFVAGILLNLLRSWLPDFNVVFNPVVDYSTKLGNMVTPLSMIIIGIKLADVPFGKLFTTGKMYFVSFIRLIAFPVLGVALMFLLRTFLPVTVDMIKGFFVAFATPVAGLASTFADQHNGDAEHGVIYTLGSTVLSVATIPVLYLLLNLLF
jgi:predicted permease